MKKIIGLFFFFLFLVTLIYGQCTPDPQYTRPGIYPDSATGFPPAVATYEYNFVITAIIPADTVFFPFGKLDIDSIGVTQIIGLPDGFQAIPSRPSGFWPGGTSGCMLITGTPTESQTGIFPLSFNVVGYMGGLGLPIPYTIDYYSITVLPASAFGIDEAGSSGNIRMKAFPNPFSDVINFAFYAREPGSYECRVFDTRGRVLKTEIITLTSGDQSYQLGSADLEPGIYFCNIRHSEKNLSAIIKLVKH
ncbi:MAG: T9SS type A sorting domain-containing protein [Lentimicrobium sp.]|nr:T9SS type A sorting domain-containing protein [Lentimicrobium sp.]